MNNFFTRLFPYSEHIKRHARAERERAGSGGGVDISDDPHSCQPLQAGRRRRLPLQVRLAARLPLITFKSKHIIEQQNKLFHMTLLILSCYIINVNCYILHVILILISHDRLSFVNGKEVLGKKIIDNILQFCHDLIFLTIITNNSSTKEWQTKKAIAKSRSDLQLANHVSRIKLAFGDV